ncbi:hypothetical protein [Actinophytocola sp.]|uniref:hypothetical protein n=1 Tax=Actinophytocola sp. TaxID=1872138 RepID=UPI0025C0DC7C|nr:hypothetical protein [Actinophytocola sp.]
MGFSESRTAPAFANSTQLDWEELARFYEWHLEHRVDELAHQESLRWLVECWTDSMTYSLRR